MGVFCFCSKNNIRGVDVWSGPQNILGQLDVFLFCLCLKRPFETMMSFCSASCLKRPRISKSASLQRYGVFLVFEYPQIHPGLFCLKYSNLHTTPRCGLFKMPEELGDILLLSGSFYGSVNGSGYISQTVHSAPACSAPLALFLDISTALDISLKHHRLLLIG